jgi:hypothetical protein
VEVSFDDTVLPFGGDTRAKADTALLMMAATASAGQLWKATPAAYQQHVKWCLAKLDTNTTQFLTLRPKVAVQPALSMRL